MRWRFARRGTSASPVPRRTSTPTRSSKGSRRPTQYVTASESAQDAIRHAVAGLAGAETGTSFVQTFAYASGAGYGLLLDALSPGWHRKVTGARDFGQLLSAAAGVTAAPDAAAAAARYDGAFAAGCRRAARSRPAGNHTPSCAGATSMLRCWWCRARAVAASTTRAPRSFPALARCIAAWRPKARGDSSDAEEGRSRHDLLLTATLSRCRRRLSSMRRR